MGSESPPPPQQVPPPEEEAKWFLVALTSPDNNVRNQAEAYFQQLKNEQPDYLVCNYFVKVRCTTKINNFLPGTEGDIYIDARVLLALETP